MEALIAHFTIVATIYTLGHSTRDLADFSAVLAKRKWIQLLVDIRAFPMSRRLPHFNPRSGSEFWLPEIGIEYRWTKELGGRPERNSCRVP